jgi:hypothetical protein
MEKKDQKSRGTIPLSIYIREYELLTEARA